MAGNSQVSDEEDSTEELEELNNFTCCGKSCAVRVCINCFGRFHKSCSERDTQNKGIEIIDESKVRCCDTVSGSVNRLNTQAREIIHLKSEIKIYKKLVKEMEDKNKLLMEKVKRLEDFPNQRSDLPTRTFADTVSNRKPLDNTPTIVVKSTRADQPKNKTMKDIQKVINPTSLKVGVRLVKETKEGSVIIKCGKSEDTDKLRHKISEKLGKAYDVDLAQLRKPATKIIGVKEKYELQEAAKKLVLL